MEHTWILVADRAKARLYELSGTGADPVEIGDFVHPQADADGQGAFRDRQPRTHDRFGPARHAIEPHTSAKDREAEHFARELDDVLRLACDARRCGDVILVAPPRFLGTLEATLSDTVRSHVTGRIAKDLVSADPRALKAQLHGQLRH